MNFLKNVIIISFLALICQAKNYTGYKTYRIYAKNDGQVNLLNFLRETTNLDFWTGSRIIGKPTDVMVPARNIKSFETMMQTNYFNACIWIDDVTKDTSQQPKRRNLHINTNGDISFEKYERYATISAYLTKLAHRFPQKVSLLNLGKSYEGRDIPGVRLSTGGNDKPVILIDAGMHGRQWISPAVALYIIDQLVNNPATEMLTKRVDWYIIPVLNPDEYEKSHNNENFWKKTPKIKKCQEENNNRNSYSQNAKRSNDNEYTTGLSPEITAIKNLTEENKGNIKLSLSFHSYGKMILYPGPYSEKNPKNLNEQQYVGRLFQKAIKAAQGNEYILEFIGDISYPASAGSLDYMIEVFGIPLSYSVVLPGGDSNDFNPSRFDILDIAQEIFQGVGTLWKYVEEKWGQ